MNLRLEQLAKWALLTALIVLMGAPTFNKQTIAGENKMAGLADLSTNIAQPGSGFAYNSGSGMGGGGGGGTGGEPFTAVLGSSSVADGAISYGNDGSMQIYRNGSWQPFNQDTGAPTAGLSGGSTGPTAAQTAGPCRRPCRAAFGGCSSAPRTRCHGRCRPPKCRSGGRRP